MAHISGHGSKCVALYGKAVLILPKMLCCKSKHGSPVHIATFRVPKAFTEIVKSSKLNIFSKVYSPFGPVIEVPYQLGHDACVLRVPTRHVMETLR